MKSLLSLVSSVLLILGSFILSRNPDIGSNLRVFYAGFALASVGYVGLLYWGLPVRGRRFLQKL